MPNVDGQPPVFIWLSTEAADVTCEPLVEPVPYLSDPHPPASSALPRVIWTYWHGESLPLIVRACMASWKRYLPEYRVRLLDPASLPPGLPPLRPGFTEWSAQTQSDWVRLAVLSSYGGVWMDATTLLIDATGRSPLSFAESLHAQRAYGPLGLFGYFNQERTHDAMYPMLENWFLAAPAGSVFMQQWWETFDAMLLADGRSDVGRVVTGASAFGGLKDVTIPDLLQGFSHEPEYFACHAAAQWVMRRNGGRLALIPAELDAFFEPHSRAWNPARVCTWLCDVGPKGARPPARPLTKLIGLLWRPLEARLQQGNVHPESILGELCALC